MKVMVFVFRPISFTEGCKKFHIFINFQPQAVSADDDDDGVDLFGSDDEEESADAAKIREERLAAYNAKKAKSKFTFPY